MGGMILQDGMLINTCLNIASVYGLVPSGNKPVTEPMLTAYLNIS